MVTLEHFDHRVSKVRSTFPRLHLFFTREAKGYKIWYRSKHYPLGPYFSIVLLITFLLDYLLLFVGRKLMLVTLET